MGKPARKATPIPWTSEESAVAQAMELSQWNPKSIWRVYRTPANHWVRCDAEPLSSVDGVALTHVAAFLGGKQVRP